MTTHQGIAFDDGEMLLDGQHRLAAIAESGVTVTLLISKGWPRQAKGKETKQMDAVDIGLARSVADILGLQHGLSEPRYVVMATRAVAAICMGERIKKLTVATTLDVLRQFRVGIGFAVAEKINIIGLRDRSLMGAVAFAYGAVATEKIKVFYSRCKTGESLAVGHPILTLRNYLMGLNASKCRQTKADPFRCSIGCLTALDRFLDGKAWEMFRPDDEVLERFSAPQAKQVKAVQTMLGGV